MAEQDGTSPLRRFYDGPLASLERGIVVLLATVVVLGGLYLTVGRGIKVTLIDAATIQTVVFLLTFYLALFGGVLATRRWNHIAIDAVTPHLKPDFRHRLEGVLGVVSGVVALGIAFSAFRYVFTIVDADAEIIPGLEGAIWSARLWRFPIGLCFVWISIHFFVGGITRLRTDPPAEIETDEARAAGLDRDSLNKMPPAGTAHEADTTEPASGTQEASS